MPFQKAIHMLHISEPEVHKMSSMSNLHEEKNILYISYKSTAGIVGRRRN